MQQDSTTGAVVGGTNVSGIRSANSRWKLLLVNDVLSICYAQRIHACFQYLDVNNAGYFTLKEFSIAGSQVMEHLPLTYDQKSMFAVMDQFRLFDRFGDGRVYLDGFIVGIIESLRSLMANKSLLSECAVELGMVHLDNVNPRLVKNFSSEEWLAKAPKFWKTFSILEYYLLPKIKQASERPHLVNYRSNSSANANDLDSDFILTFSHILVETLVYAEKEIMHYFHVTTQKLNSLLLDLSDGDDKTAETHENLIAGFSIDLGCHVLWDIRTGDSNIALPLQFSSSSTFVTNDGTNDSTINSRLREVGAGSMHGNVHIPSSSLGLRHGNLFGTLARDVNNEIAFSTDSEAIGISEIFPMKINMKTNLLQVVDYLKSFGASIQEPNNLLISVPLSDAERRDSINQQAKRKGSTRDFNSSSHFSLDGLDDEDAGLVDVTQLDDCQIFLLQTAYKSLLNFFGLINIAYNPDTKALVDSLSMVANSLNGGMDFEKMQGYLEASTTSQQKQVSSSNNYLKSHHGISQLNSHNKISAGGGISYRSNRIEDDDSGDDHDNIDQGDDISLSLSVSSSHKHNPTSHQKTTSGGKHPWTESNNSSPNVHGMGAAVTNTSKKRAKRRQGRDHPSTFDFFSIMATTKSVFRPLEGERSTSVHNGCGSHNRSVSKSWRDVLLPHANNRHTKYNLNKPHDEIFRHDGDEDDHTNDLENNKPIYASSLRSSFHLSCEISGGEHAAAAFGAKSFDGNERKILEASLVEELMATQYELQKTKLRMDIIEMIQDHAAALDTSTTINPGNLTQVLSNSNGSGEFEEKKESEGNSDCCLPSDSAVSFDDIVEELRSLRCLLAERGSMTQSLGTLAAEECALIMLNKDLSMEADNSVAAASSTSPVRSYNKQQDQTPSHSTEGGSARHDLSTPSAAKQSASTHSQAIVFTDLIQDLRDYAIKFHRNVEAAHEDFHDHANLIGSAGQRRPSSLLSKGSFLGNLQTNVHGGKQMTTNNINNADSHDIIAALEDEVFELKSFKEQVLHERNENLNTSIELQVLREKVLKSQQQANQTSQLQQLNAELSAQVQTLETQLTEARASSKAHASSTNDKVFDDMRLMNQELHQLCDELGAEKDRLIKDSQRVQNSLKISEDRVKAALQDQFNLHQQLQTTEDELSGSRSFIKKLMSDLENERLMREMEDERYKVIGDLRRDIVKKDAELLTLKEESALARKYKQELSAAENSIEVYEEKLTELMRETEHGAIAIEQLDKYRSQLSEYTKNSRELTLQVKGLESQLKSMQHLQAKYKEVSEELQDCKIRVEKIPTLLAEVARLRGSSRASMKAISEQDKILSDVRQHTKQLEKENTRLKADNRSMQDLEIKLRDANAEITKLMLVAGEVNALKAGAKNAEEERQNLEGQFKKMRKFIRQSVMSPDNFQSAAMSLVPSSSRDTSSYGQDEGRFIDEIEQHSGPAFSRSS